MTVWDYLWLVALAIVLYGWLYPTVRRGDEDARP